MSLTKWVVKGALARDRPDEPPRDEVLEQQKASARAVGLEWPLPRRGPGMPEKQQEWRELLYAHIRREGALPKGIGASPPKAWVAGQTLDELALVEQEVIASVPAGAEEREMMRLRSPRERGARRQV